MNNGVDVNNEVVSAATPPTRRRLTRGAVELRGSNWSNRYREEIVDPVTGATFRCQARMALGPYRSRAAAEEALNRYLALLGADALAPGPCVTAGEYFGTFDRLRIALMRPESRRAYRGVIRRYLAPAFGAKPLASVDCTALQELVAYLHQRGLSRASIEIARNRMLEILRHARAAGFAAHAIARSAVKLPSEQRPQLEQRHISPAELERILAASEWPRRALWAVQAYAGLRIGEALALTWSHIDLAQGAISVRQACVGGRIAPLKTRRSSRDVPILPELNQILAQARARTTGEATGLLFTSRKGTPLRADDVRRRWLKPLLEQLGIAHAGCHAFRHSLPGRLDELGLSPAAIQRFMGHASLSQTESYLHRSADDLREQLAAALQRGRDERESRAA